MAKATVKVRLVLSEGGAFHNEEIELPSASLEGYDRLVDCLREDPEVLKRVHVDVSRVAVAYVVPKGG